MAVQYICAACGAMPGLGRPVWRCACGGMLDLTDPDPFDARLVDEAEPGLWRYAEALPAVPAADRVRLGEAMTPLLTSGRFGARLKLDYLLPTGSYKDRGSALLVSRLHSLGIQDVIEDSSGNAGASMASYAAAAGMRCEIVTPARNSPTKLAQIRATGAVLTTVDGDREAASEAVLAELDRSFYASHTRHPDFVAGVSTVGFEIWEQLGRRAPDAIVAPCGQGSILLGLARAFSALHEGGAVASPPRLYAIQAEAYSAVADAYARGLEVPDPSEPDGRTIAEGIATRVPLRGRLLLRALRASSGKAIAVSEAAIRRSTVRLAESGIYVEPTSATALAGLDALREAGDLSASADVVLVLTGFGLKAAQQVADLQEQMTRLAHSAAPPSPADQKCSS